MIPSFRSPSVVIPSVDGVEVGLRRDGLIRAVKRLNVSVPVSPSAIDAAEVVQSHAWPGGLSSESLGISESGTVTDCIKYFLFSISGSFFDLRFGNERYF